MLNASLMATFKANLDSDYTNDLLNPNRPYRYPFGYIYNRHKTYYENYRSAKYNKLSTQISNSNTFDSFNGDCYTGGYRHTSLSYLKTTERTHAQKGSGLGLLKILAGVVLIAASIVSFGATGIIGVGLLVAGAGSIVIGVKGVIDQEKFKELSGEHYEKGLKRTFFDNLFYRSFYNNVEIDPSPSIFQRIFSASATTGQLPFQDNSILYYSQVIGDFVFQSDINFILRVESETQKNDYLRPYSEHMPDRARNTVFHRYNADESRAGSPNYDSINNAMYKSGSSWKIGNTEFSTMYQHKDIGVPIDNDVYRYFLNKLCKVNPERHASGDREIGGYEYKMPDSIFYIANKDYFKVDDIKGYYPIPFEYSMCSECRETFPQRFIWSEKDFAESLTDNFTKWLPNNYKDISGEYGDIVNIFVFNNILYIHTTEGLWMQPTNYQERITNGVVSYIGTGEFGSLPAQLVIDDKSGNSAGIQHREAFVLTPYGYFFVNEREQKIYKFDGKLTPISSVGISKWLNENITINIDKIYRGLTGEEYLYRDNPSNKYGTGFILTYDTEKERILVTKRDFNFVNESLIEKDSMIVISKGEVYKIKDFKLIKGSLGNELVTDYKKKIMQEMLYTYTNGSPISNDVIIPNEKVFEYVGVRNKRLVFQTFIEKDKETIKVYGFIKAVLINETDTTNLSWTLSYSLKNNSWTSFHSYLPNFYARMNDSIFSYSLEQDSKNGLYIHSEKGFYQTFYTKEYPYIVEYVSNNNPLVTKIFNHLRFITEAYKYDENSKSFYEERYVTFNKVLFSNTRQCSGVLDLFVKNTSQEENYLIEQVKNLNNGTIILDRNEKDWLLNDIRDYVIKYDIPIFNENRKSFIGEKEFIDKKLNDGVISLNKNWYDLESFRDKFLVVRLIFDTFANENKHTKLVLNISNEHSNISQY